VKAFRFGFRLVLVAIAGLFGASLFAVELPAIQLSAIFPPGGKAGSDVEVGITGAEIEEAATMRFSHPGITAKLKAANRFVVTIAPDVPPGIYDARIVGLSGVSNPRAFVVSNQQELVKNKDLSKPENAQELPLDAVFSGAIPAAVNDYFKFTARKGQRLLVECLAPEIDSKLSPVLAVLDSAGKELEVSRSGGLLDFTAPADGSYLVRLSDLSFGGDPDHYYRISVTTAPHIDFVFPLSGQPGVKSKFTLYGRNLPGGAPANVVSADGKALEKLDVEIEAPASPDFRADGLTALEGADADGFTWRLKTAQGISNPVFIGLGGTPGIVEQTSNQQPAQAQKVTPPCEIDGQFLPPEATHWFSFDAKKGDVWWIEVISNRFDARTDPLLVVQRDGADGQEAAAPDAPVKKRFHTGSNDPAYRLEAKEDGTYRVALSDLFATTRPDPRKVFRLSIHKESPDFRLAAFVEPPPEKADDRTAVPNAAFVRGGGTTAIRVVAFRHDNFGGDIELSAEGLPAGVTCAPTKILAGKSEGWLLLTCGEKPASWAGSIRIIGKARAGEKDLVREARGGVIIWPVANIGTELVQTRLTRDVALAVSAKEAAPISVKPAEEKLWEAASGSKLEIPLKITRGAGFKDALKLKAFGAPGVEAMKAIDVAAGAAVATATLDLKALAIPAGEHTIYFESPAKGKYRGKDVSTTIFSEAIRIAIKAPEPKKP
jgi:hypothetical protein